VDQYNPRSRLDHHSVVSRPVASCGSATNCWTNTDDVSRLVQTLLLAASMAAVRAGGSPLVGQSTAPYTEAITVARLRADPMILAGGTPENALARAG